MSGIGIVPKDPNDAPQSPSSKPRTPFEALRQRREELAQAQERPFVVPGYEAFTDIDGDPADLVARYERLDIAEYRAALFGPADSDSHRDAQFLIDALTGLFWRVGDRLMPLLDNDQDAGWHDLAPHVAPGDFPTDATAVDQVVEAIFAGDTIALAEHAAEVARWMEQGHTAADREFLGGS